MGKVIGSSIDAAASVATNVATNATNAAMNKRTNETNLQINRETNEFNEREAEKAFGREVEMMNLQNAYNDPSQQVARFSNAGLNPALMMQNGQTSIASSPGSQPQAQAVQPTPMQAPHLQEFQGAGGFIKPFVEMAKLKKDIAEAGKIGADTARLELTLNDYVSQMNLETQRKKLEYDIQLCFGSRLEDAKVRNLLSQAELNYFTAYKFAQEGDEAKARVSMTRAMERYYDATAFLNGYEAETARQRAETYREEFNNRMKVLRSEAARNKAQAYQANSEAWKNYLLTPVEKDRLESEAQKNHAYVVEYGLTQRSEREKLANEVMLLYQQTVEKSLSNAEKQAMLKNVLFEAERMNNQYKMDKINPLRFLQMVLFPVSSLVNDAVSGMFVK